MAKRIIAAIFAVSGLFLTISTPAVANTAQGIASTLEAPDFTKAR